MFKPGTSACTHDFILSFCLSHGISAFNIRSTNVLLAAFITEFEITLILLGDHQSLVKLHQFSYSSFVSSILLKYFYNAKNTNVYFWKYLTVFENFV